MIPRLKELYTKQIRSELKEKFNFKNSYMAPKIEKIVLNMGLGIDGNDNERIQGFVQFGNYTFGIKEHIIFPEVNFDKVDKIRGLDITIVISSLNQEHSHELLKKLNFPFKMKGIN